MIMMGDKKKAITAILGPESPNVGEREKEEEGPSAIRALGEECMEAFANKDVDGFIESLKAIFQEFESDVEGPSLS